MQLLISKIKNIITYLIVILTLFSVMACNKDKSGPYYNFKNSNTTFDGNVYEFLQSQNGAYDSLLLVINKLTGLKDTLENSKNITLFAVANQSFQIAEKNSNIYRKINFHLAPQYLSDVDSAQLDTLTCRYIFSSKYPTDSLKKYINGLTVPSLRYNYEMNLLYERQDASGYVGGGPQEIIFSNPKNTQFQVYWINTNTTSVNILTKNGVVHVLSTSGEFGLGEYTFRANGIPVVMPQQ